MLAGALVVLVLVTTAGGRSTTFGAAAASAPRGGGPASGGPRVLMMGDSIAQSLVPGLERQGVNIIDRSHSGCRILRGSMVGYAASSCSDRDAWKTVLKQVKPAFVILQFGTWDLEDVKPQGRSRTLEVGTPQWEKYYTSQVRRVVRTRGRRGRQS